MEPAVATPGWGRRNGYLAVGESAADLSITQVKDRLLILDVINRYGWGYDERDLSALEQTFTPDAIFDGRVAGALPVGPFAGRTAIIDWLKQHMIAQDDQRKHTILNHIFAAQTVSTAVVNSYLVLTSVAAGQARLVTTGFYKFEMEKHDGVWAIGHVFAGFDSTF